MGSKVVSGSQVLGSAGGQVGEVTDVVAMIGKADRWRDRIIEERAGRVMEEFVLVVRAFKADVMVCE
jgi:hypothetical protein